jgi:hypothetical protein
MRIASIHFPVLYTLVCSHVHALRCLPYYRVDIVPPHHRIQQNLRLLCHRSRRLQRPALPLVSVLAEAGLFLATRGSLSRVQRRSSKQNILGVVQRVMAAAQIILHRRLRL